MDRDDENGLPLPSDRDSSAGERVDSDAEQPPVGVEPAAPTPGTTDVQAYIGRQLRAVYDDIVKQPIPDRLLDLMRQLEDLPRP